MAKEIHYHETKEIFKIQMFWLFSCCPELMIKKLVTNKRVGTIIFWDGHNNNDNNNNNKVSINF